jgi:sugar lactone lactonase YvrE
MRSPIITAGQLCLCATLLASAGCAPRDSDASALWRGTMDTLETGTVVVTNPATGVWADETAWRVVEELRIGTLDDAGPDMFGRIRDLEVDAEGRLWIFESQAQELRVFDGDGAHVRTVGREGGGPGEFANVIGIAWAPDGNLWTVDPSNARISIIDTAGNYVGSHGTVGGWMFVPWPGGLDAQGRFWNFSPDLSRAPEPSIVMIAYDDEMNPLDTVPVPEYPGEREVFELRDENSHLVTGVPFTSSLEWRFDPRGYMWFMLTGDYSITQLSLEGDTLRRISREFEPLPVTEADVDSAMADLDWFIRNGGKVDRALIPGSKPATEEFLFDGEGNIWVLTVTAREEEGRVVDVFDPEGRYLGRIDLPFRLSMNPPPVFRGAVLYAVTEDELEVPYVVRARIEKP